jgi:hypothetical protein
MRNEERQDNAKWRRGYVGEMEDGTGSTTCSHPWRGSFAASGLAFDFLIIYYLRVLRVLGGKASIFLGALRALAVKLYL